MIASITYPTSNDKVGELQVRFRRNEDLLLGGVVGPVEGFASLDDALSGAASLSQQSRGGAFAVKQDGDRFQAHELLQNVWTKRFMREEAFGVDRAQIEALRGTGTAPEFGFFKFRTNEYGRADRPHRGTVKLDAASGIQAIVGGNWALVDGMVRDVAAVRPKPPVDPKPPIDPKPPVDPNPPVSRGVVEDVTEGLRLSREAARIITTIPQADTGTDATKDARIKAFNTNMAAQKRIEAQFGVADEGVVSALRAADASLEDANWQLAKKPSPDGRFNGVDVPGALRDTERAVELLDELLARIVTTAA
jgi:hypothetical protein